MAPSTATAEAFLDGTTDYVPIRGNTGAKLESHKKKVHIADTPMTFSNWPQHINWLNTTLVVFIPVTGLVLAYWIPLQTYTAIWAFIYYFNSGLGITAGKFVDSYYSLRL
jgi:stearoyl-CoA desaturase (Delta-9 desaturase)